MVASMSNVPSLLPPNATAIERHIEQTAARIDSIPIDFASLLNPYECPLENLPWLAWQMSVDEWDDSWDEQRKREIIANSIAIHRHKGTPGALKRALNTLGYHEVEILEPTTEKYDGVNVYDGSITHGNDMHWAEFDVILNVGTTPTPEQTLQIINSINNYKPVRSHLRNLRYASIFYDGEFNYDGTITHDGGFVDG
jgi:phage tail P2-like protein